MPVAGTLSNRPTNKSLLSYPFFLPLLSLSSTQSFLCFSYPSSALTFPPLILPCLSSTPSLPPSSSLFCHILSSFPSPLYLLHSPFISLLLFSSALSLPFPIPLLLYPFLLSTFPIPLLLHTFIPLLSLFCHVLSSFLSTLYLLHSPFCAFHISLLL